MTMKHYMDAGGNYLGGWPEGHEDTPEGAIENEPPSNASFVWHSEVASWCWPVKIVGLAREEAKKKHFHNINYEIDVVESLYPKRTFKFGALVNVEWYSDPELTDLVLDVDMTYNYDVLGFAVDREVTRTWIKNDGTPHEDVKVTTKDYTINPQDQLDEAITRRTNNVRQINLWLIEVVPGLTAADENIDDVSLIEVRDSGVAFFEQYQLETTTYIETGSQLLEQQIIAETDQQWNWFDADASILQIVGVSDVRDWIIFQLSNGQRNKDGDIE
jgi:hypothetical protein